MKGFIHIVEIIIIVVTIFVILIQFSLIPRIQSDFVRTKQLLQANDILYSLEAKSIDWFDKTLIEEQLTLFLPTTAEISLKIRNVIKPHIEVACYCNSTEFGNISSALSDFTINDRLISFNLTDLDHTDDPLAFSLAYDVILLAPSVFNENPNPSLDPYKDRMLAYLRNDRGIVEMRDFLAFADVSDTQNTIFGLDYYPSAVTGSSDLSFSRTLKIQSSVGLKISADENFYNIYKNYYFIPVFNDSFTEPNGPASRWTVKSGSWNVISAEYEGAISDGIGAATVNLNLSEAVIKTVFNASTSGSLQNAYIVISYRDLQNLHYAGADVSGNKWVIGEVSGGSTTETDFPETINPDTDYELMVKNDNGNVTLFVDGVQKVQHNFGLGSIPNGNIGLAVVNATTKFDDVRITFPEIHDFQNFLRTQELIRQDDYPKEDRTIVLQPSNRTAAVIVNYRIVNEKGRTAWISDGNNNMEEKKILIKDIVIFAAGDELDIIKRDVRNPTITSFFKVINKDSFEIIEIVMSISKIFQ